MLFNSILFVFVFLPIFLAGFFPFGRLGLQQWALAWAVIASLAFYSWEDPLRLLPIILTSAIFNYFVGRGLARSHNKPLLVIGLAGNLLFLAYFKYASFLLSTAAAVTGLALPQVHIALPIGISFYTFTQIAFLVDAYRSEAREYDPLKYGLFVSYFPHLVAGPILHHKEMMPQFDDPAIYRLQLSNMVLGLTWFAAGLFKKVMFADNIAAYAAPVFSAAAAGTPLSFADSWIGVMSYALQLYFDFSGYSDMAIGLALMMGIHFPLNFDSPYKTTSLIDFWRRWHMTLSRFLRDYLYFPLGGGRKGPLRRYLNLFITMVLGGLWHGATWNFVIWGAIHGAGLFLNHLWRGALGRFGLKTPAFIGWAATFTLVTFAWVPFRAETMEAAWRLWNSMLGLACPVGPSLDGAGAASVWIAVLLAVALFAPNTQQILTRDWEIEEALLRWRPNLAWAAVMGCLFGVAVGSMVTKPSAFLYFRF